MLILLWLSCEQEAATILHEIMHLCGTGLNALPGGWPGLIWREGLDLAQYGGREDEQDGGLADDDDSCWAIQNQAAMNFLYALGQRVPCLADASQTCCPKSGDRYFASAEFLAQPMPWSPGGPPC